MKKRILSCVQPDGRFIYGIHKPSYTVKNMRGTTRLDILGEDENGVVHNTENFPAGTVEVAGADWIYEIPNPFPFRGRTFIDKEWADHSAEDPARIKLPQMPAVSMSEMLGSSPEHGEIITKLPAPLQLALATTSTDPRDLVLLARACCELIEEEGEPIRLRYSTKGGRRRAIIHDHLLFEGVANNPHLPNEYKVAMVIRPGAQGGSEIVGEWKVEGESHIYEYLRRNSYISGGHYAANMAEDAIRYSTLALSECDMEGLRHLYCQRSFVRLADALDLPVPKEDRTLSSAELEELRLAICTAMKDGTRAEGLSATLWGWNYGFDYAPTGYRLHASHQQIHQQYAMLPEEIEAFHGGSSETDGTLPAYGCGDLIADVIEQYAAEYHSDFFEDYRQAIQSNERMDERILEKSLVVWRDENVMLFVPKAQTSQWELQLMTLPGVDGRLPGNIVECNPAVRRSLNQGLRTAQRVLAGMGARMVTSIEFPKRLGAALSQPLLYSLLPRLPESPGAFSEAQLRFIIGHFPEDFAVACRKQL